MEKPTDGIAGARAELEQERDTIKTQMADSSVRLKQVQKVLSALNDLDSVREPRRRRRKNKPTASLREYVSAVRSVLDERPHLSREELRVEVGDRIAELGKSRVALSVRISQALRELDVALS